jgi:membrane protein implicated in regulation of membrane protease activity
VQDLLGKEAKLLVGVKPSQLGKIRFEVKGEIIDMIAVAEDDSVIETGEQVLIVGVEGNQARVARRRDIFEE